MRHVPLTLAALPILAASLAAQDRPDPEEELRQKLASPFLHHADWTTDYDVARQRAADAGKLILGYFTTAGY